MRATWRTGALAALLLVGACTGTDGAGTDGAGATPVPSGTSTPSDPSGTTLEALDAEPSAEVLCALLTPDEVGDSGGPVPDTGVDDRQSCRWEYDDGDVLDVELTSYPQGQPRSGVLAAFDEELGPVGSADVQGRTVAVGPSAAGTCRVALVRTLGELALEVSRRYAGPASEPDYTALCDRAVELAGALVPRLPVVAPTASAPGSAPLVAELAPADLCALVGSVTPAVGLPAPTLEDTPLSERFCTSADRSVSATAILEPAPVVDATVETVEVHGRPLNVECEDGEQACTVEVLKQDAVVQLGVSGRADARGTVVALAEALDLAVR